MVRLKYSRYVTTDAEINCGVDTRMQPIATNQSINGLSLWLAQGANALQSASIQEML